MSESLHVVWFKRDLRIRDHAPLSLAAQAGRVLPLYVFEPELWSSPDMSARHLWWVTESVRELRGALTALGQPLVIRSGDIVEVLRDILDQLGPFTLWSHEETGNAQTFERDKRVARFCRENSLPWNEPRQFGVVRRLYSREGWSEQWENLMTSPIFSPPATLERIQIELGEVPAPPSEFTPSSAHQKPGELAGGLCLRSFLTERCENYSKSISSPITAQLHGSRMSPYLAWGNISMRQVVTETREAMAHLRSLPPHHRGAWLRSLSAFESRLHWHCHFIQKLESEPEIEFRAFIPSLDTMRAGHHNESLLCAWQEGRTGYPFVDACMRSLRATGWINFRMRAMLVSFAAYDLFLDWRTFSHFLANQFLDYEPGIHYPQIQMQSGTTGINALRMYDPVKQGYDHDSRGDFIRTWVPELTKIQGQTIHEPWRLSPLELREAGIELGQEYPERVVNHQEAVRVARTRIAQARGTPETKAATKSTLAKHGSRKRRARSKERRESQLSLF
jgi:deoxyribodipyrimidine photo-lyase